MGTWHMSWGVGFSGFSIFFNQIKIRIKMRSLRCAIKDHKDSFTGRRQLYVCFSDSQLVGKQYSMRRLRAAVQQPPHDPNPALHRRLLAVASLSLPAPKFSQVCCVTSTNRSKSTNARARAPRDTPRPSASRANTQRGFRIPTKARVGPVK